MIVQPLDRDLLRRQYANAMPFPFVKIEKRVRGYVLMPAERLQRRIVGGVVKLKQHVKRLMNSASDVSYSEQQLRVDPGMVGFAEWFDGTSFIAESCQQRQPTQPQSSSNENDRRRRSK